MKNTVQHPCGNEVVTKWLRSAGMTILCIVVQKVTLRWQCGETGFCTLVGAPGFCRLVINSSPSLSAWARDDTVRNGSPSLWRSHQARHRRGDSKNVRGCAHGSGAGAALTAVASAKAGATANAAIRVTWAADAAISQRMAAPEHGRIRESRNFHDRRKLNGLMDVRRHHALIAPPHDPGWISSERSELHEWKTTFSCVR